MGSSAQNSSGVHWCRRRVRFNEVPEKVPKAPEKVWKALVQSQVRFNSVPEKVPALAFAARFRKICKNTTLRLWGIPPKAYSGQSSKYFASVVVPFPEGWSEWKDGSQ